MGTKRAGDHGFGVITVGAVAVAAGLIGWILGARGGNPQYRQLMEQLQQVVDQAQQRAREAQDLLRDKTDALADAVKDSGEQAQDKLEQEKTDPNPK